MIVINWEYKLLPTPEQKEYIEHTLNVCRSVWNYNLRELKDYLNSRSCSINSCSLVKEYILSADAEFPNYYHQASNLVIAKKNNDYLKSAPSQVLQQVLRKLEAAFVDMKKRQFGFPRFKNKYGLRSFVYPQLNKGKVITNNQIRLPKLDWVTYINSRPIPDGFKIKQARIIRKASGYFVMLSLQSDVNIPDPIPHGKAIGIDLGLDEFAATSEGLLIARPKFLKTLQREIKLLQRKLRNKKKGSQNRAKITQKIARLHQRISDTRKDFHFKTAHKLCDGNGMVFIEDLNFKSWTRGMLRKHFADAGFGNFVNILQWVCKKTDTYFAKVDKDYTSQICPRCNSLTGKKSLDVRIHQCKNCGYTNNRDVVASEVILQRGLGAAGLVVSLDKMSVVGDLTGTVGHNSLVKSRGSRKPKS